MAAAETAALAPCNLPEQFTGHSVPEATAAQWRAWSEHVVSVLSKLPIETLTGGEADD
jgi:hypothetical protein